MPIRIEIVDDNALLLASICQNLRVYSSLEIVCTAHNGSSALDQAETYQPQVVLMDIEMPGMDGIATTAELTRRFPAIKVLMLTVFDQEDKIFAAIRAGAGGYLLKDERPTRVVQAIEDVLNGGAPMSPGIALKTLGLLRRQAVGPAILHQPQPPDAFALTTREVEILECIVEGHTPRQIGERLFISTSTVRKHIENIYAKLHIHSRLEAIRLADLHQWFRS
jgi:DNA-binding NarL/FixJ family response regulator